MERLKEMFAGVRAGGFEGSKEGEQGEQDLLSYRLVAFPFLLSWLSLFLLPKNRGKWDILSLSYWSMFLLSLFL